MSKKRIDLSQGMFNLKERKDSLYQGSCLLQTQTWIRIQSSKAI